MRTRIAAAMTALALLLFPLGAWMIVSRCFELTMERERERALSEETAIARAIAMEIGDDGMETLYAVAFGAQRRYGSDTLQVALVYRGSVMAGVQVPRADGLDALLQTTGRATLLSRETQTLYVAHRLTSDLTLLLCSDVSQIYALRGALALWAGMLSLTGVVLSGVLSVVVSGWLDKPYRQLAQQRQEFIDALAHEMRTPLTAILGGVRLLERARLPEEKQALLLASMAKEAQRLSDMDARLLQLTQLEHDVPEFTRFSSMDMAQEALSAFEGVVLSGEDTVFTGDRELLIQLLRNLVVNAQRAGGDAPVQVTLRRHGFTVTDQGCGMTKEQIARAFEPFYKADKSRTRAAGGAGLGLTLCRRIARMHGATLEIDSEPGRGTSVCYRLDTTS